MSMQTKAQAALKLETAPVNDIKQKPYVRLKTAVRPIAAELSKAIGKKDATPRTDAANIHQTEHIYDVEGMSYSAEVKHLNADRNVDFVGPKKPDDSYAYDAWLAAYTGFNDGHAPQRYENRRIVYTKEVDGVLVKDYVKRRRVCVNKILATFLEPGDNWGGKKLVPLHGEVDGVTTIYGYKEVWDRSFYPTRDKHLERSLKSKRSKIESGRSVYDRMSDVPRWHPSLFNGYKTTEGWESFGRPPTVDQVIRPPASIRDRWVPSRPEEPVVEESFKPMDKKDSRDIPEVTWNVWKSEFARRSSKFLAWAKGAGAVSPSKLTEGYTRLVAANDSSFVNRVSVHLSIRESIHKGLDINNFTTTSWYRQLPDSMRLNCWLYVNSLNGQETAQSVYLVKAARLYGPKPVTSIPRLAMVSFWRGALLNGRISADKYRRIIGRLVKARSHRLGRYRDAEIFYKKYEGKVGDSPRIQLESAPTPTIISQDFSHLPVATRRLLEVMSKTEGVIIAPPTEIIVPENEVIVPTQEEIDQHYREERLARRERTARRRERTFSRILNRF